MKKLLLSLITLPLFAEQTYIININLDGSNIAHFNLFQDATCSLCNKPIKDGSEGHIVGFDEYSRCTYVCDECFEKVRNSYTVTASLSQRTK